MPGRGVNVRTWKSVPVSTHARGFKICMDELSMHVTPGNLTHVRALLFESIKVLRGATPRYQFFNYKCLKLNHKILKWVVTHRQVCVTRRFDLTSLIYNHVY